MPTIKLPDIKLPDMKIPELRLPEMSRDDIARVMGDARKDLGEIRRDLDQMRRDIELPKVDLSKIEVPKAVTAAAVSAGIVQKKPSRWPFALGAIVTVAVVGVALLRSPALTDRLRELAGQVRDKVDGMRGHDQHIDPYAFDAAVPLSIEPSAYSDGLSGSDSPFDGSSDLPVGLGSNGSGGSLGAPDASDSEYASDDQTRV